MKPLSFLSFYPAKCTLLSPKVIEMVNSFCDTKHAIQKRADMHNELFTNLVIYKLSTPCINIMHKSLTSMVLFMLFMDNKFSLMNAIHMPMIICPFTLKLYHLMVLKNLFVPDKNIYASVT